MNAVTVIALWGIASVVSAIAAGILASIKNRDHSWWAAWAFVFPPMIIFLFFLPTNMGPKPQRRSLDDGDREEREGEWI